MCHSITTTDEHSQEEEIDRRCLGPEEVRGGSTNTLNHIIRHGEDDDGLLMLQNAFGKEICCLGTLHMLNSTCSRKFVIH